MSLSWSGVVILDVVKRARRKALSAQHSTSTVSEEDIVKAKEGPGHRSAPDGAGRTSNDRMVGLVMLAIYMALFGTGFVYGLFCTETSFPYYHDGMACG